MDEVLITVEQVRPQVMGRKTVEVAGVMKNGKTLLMRLGGDMNLESLVENMYDRAVVDSRVQFFFNRDKATQRRIRMKMYQYLSGAFGGPVQYDPANLKPAHYNMNITNYHFDAILEILTRAAKEMNIDADTMDDMTQVVNGIRSDVTIGCTVRMEAARKKNETDGLDQLFMKLGGHEGISTFISRLYEFVERDNRINMFFEGSKLELIKKAQGDYISMLLGGSSEYNGRSLEEIHQTLAMTDFHLDCFLQCVQKALRDCGAEQDTTDEVVVRLESVRKAILHAHYSDAHESLEGRVDRHSVELPSASFRGMATPEGKRPRCLACLLGMLRGSRSRLHAVEVRLTDDDATFNSGAKQQKRVSRTRRFNTRATQTDESTVGGGGGRKLSVAVPVPWAGDLPTTPMSFRKQRTPTGSSFGENPEGTGNAGVSMSSGAELLQGKRHHIVFLGDTESVSDSSSSSSALSSISSFQSSTCEGEAEEVVDAAGDDNTSRSACAPPEESQENVAALQRRLREREAQTRALMHRWRVYVRGGAVHDVDRIISMRIESPCGLRRGATSSLALSGDIAFVVMSQHPPHSSALLGLEDPDSLVPGLLKLNLGGGDSQEKEVEGSGPE
ncbi:hypothetical protein FOZ62_031500, partial [Perkinsus olseni]